MSQVNFSLKAKDDLIVILSHTELQWGKSQRAKYRNQLKERFSYLAQNPQKGRQSSNIKKILRFYHEGRHVIFYREITNGIEVVRILHDRMDFERHL